MLQVYGAVTMNNTMCLGIFLLVVHSKHLRWTYTSEVLVTVGGCPFRELAAEHAGLHHCLVILWRWESFALSQPKCMHALLGLMHAWHMQGCTVTCCMVGPVCIMSSWSRTTMHLHPIVHIREGGGILRRFNCSGGVVGRAHNNLSHSLGLACTCTISPFNFCGVLGGLCVQVG